MVHIPNFISAVLGNINPVINLSGQSLSIPNDISTIRTAFSNFRNNLAVARDTRTLPLIEALFVLLLLMTSNEQLSTKLKNFITKISEILPQLIESLTPDEKANIEDIIKQISNKIRNARVLPILDEIISKIQNKPNVTETATPTIPTITPEDVFKILREASAEGANPALVLFVLALLRLLITIIQNDGLYQDGTPVDSLLLVSVIVLTFFIIVPK